MDGKLSCHFQIAWTFYSQRQCTVCVSHISTKPQICKNVQGAHGVSLTRSLIQNHKRKIIIITWPFSVCVYVWVFEWVFVCMLASAQVCVLYMWKGQIGDCSHLIICK